MNKVKNTNLLIANYQGAKSFEDFPYNDLAEFDERLLEYISHFFTDNHFLCMEKSSEVVMEVMCQFCLDDYHNGYEICQRSSMIKISIDENTEKKLSIWKEIMGIWSEFSEGYFILTVCHNCQYWFVEENPKL
ncbi:hypothetical protein [Jeotgalibacillus haloalkalitolerans]|uniref:Uncharacterized protein n=1 Tax=Jeotgalibacillus haloalkalitolerans TaxID=3104292 RepID=A0ABU5KJT5_9BACL|nr:hypothetical protein [Jeotgalibacillus sp. HH7-29]MDZ5711343.1 hypothetical protein [Jeotgalibacillus sp. HH7-29]